MLKYVYLNFEIAIESDIFKNCMVLYISKVEYLNTEQT